LLSLDRALTRSRPDRILIQYVPHAYGWKAMNLPFAIDGLIHPTGTSHAWTDIIAIVIGVTGAIAGFAAFAELRRDKPTIRAFRAPVGEAMAILVVGVLVGTSYVSVSGFRTLEGTPGLGVANGVITAPAQAPVELDAARRSARRPSKLRTGRARFAWSMPTRVRTRSTSKSTAGSFLPVPARYGSCRADLARRQVHVLVCIPGHRSTMEGALKLIE
jgi:hypothetical protein